MDERNEETGTASRHIGEDSAHTRFLSALADHLSGPSDGTWRALKTTAQDLEPAEPVASVRWGSEIDVRVGPLLEGDRVTWGLLLESLSHPPADEATAALRALSPYAGKAVVFVHDGPGGPSFHGDTAPVLERALEGLPREALPAALSLVAFDLPPPATAEPVAEIEQDVGC